MLLCLQVSGGHSCAILIVDILFVPKQSDGESNCACDNYTKVSRLWAVHTCMHCAHKHAKNENVVKNSLEHGTRKNH